MRAENKFKFERVPCFWFLINCQLPWKNNDSIGGQTAKNKPKGLTNNKQITKNLKEGVKRAVQSKKIRPKG